MVKGIYVVAQNMVAKEKNLEMVASNLANINTTGYKRELPFSEIIALYQQEPVKNLTDFSQGTLSQTYNPLDLGITGNGSFAVKTENGIEYTRNGRFRVSDEGFLVNEQGYKVLGRKGEIDFMQTELNKDQTITISESGEIRMGDQVIDKLYIAKFDNNISLLRKEGLNFSSPDGGFDLEEAPEDGYSVRQGYLEESNVNPLIEMQAMISIQKEFESSQKVINTLDRSLEKANEAGRV